ncbi:MAG TPA: hypothetical protein VLB76_17790 [Thermoanaerobaculia bacterium]|jgi:hypothetical protein|nr:hypothetical protein [Thermoanaerobaculia bacterium]
MKLALKALIAAAGTILVTGAGFASLILGIHDSSPAQKVFQAIALPLLYPGVTYDWLGTALWGWLALALGGIFWFALIFAGLGVFQRRRTAET